MNARSRCGPALLGTRATRHALGMSLWVCALAALSPWVLAQSPPAAAMNAKQQPAPPPRARSAAMPIGHPMLTAQADRNAQAEAEDPQVPEASAVEPPAEMDMAPMQDRRESADANEPTTPIDPSMAMLPSDKRTPEQSKSLQALPAPISDAMEMESMEDDRAPVGTRESATPIEHAMPMPPADMAAPEKADALEASSAPMSEGMDMGSMTDGRVPADARDPDAYAEGYEYTGMPGLEQTDQIAFGYVLADELEFLSGNEGEGFAWSLQASNGGDRNKLWLRTQGLKVPDGLDSTSSGEVLWWRPYSPFWGTQLGIRQDFGQGARTYLAAGIQGLSPYWFDIEATAYVGEDGRLAARLKASYDILFTNRLILTPSAEANVYSRADEERGLGAGLGNVEGGLRLRYEVHRKFAPYIGYVWERAFAGTADRRRADGEPISEHRFVAGIRMWF
jgi:copper resistance protein B